MPEAAAPVCQKASIALPHRRSDEKTERRSSYRTIQLAYEVRPSSLFTDSLQAWTRLSDRRRYGSKVRLLLTRTGAGIEQRFVFEYCQFVRVASKNSRRPRGLLVKPNME